MNNTGRSGGTAAQRIALAPAEKPHASRLGGRRPRLANRSELEELAGERLRGISIARAAA